MYIIKYLTFHVEKGKSELDVMMWDEPPAIPYYVIKIQIPAEFKICWKGNLDIELQQGENHEQKSDG